MEAFITHRRSLPALPETHGQPVDMAVSDFGRLLDFLASNREPACMMTGGEPTLHPDFAQLVALTRRKKLEPVVETCGVMPDDVAAFVVSEQLQLSWRLYHPRFYGPEEAQRMLAFAREVGRGDRPMCVLITASETADDYAWAEDFLRQTTFNQVVLRSLSSQDLEGKRAFATWAAGFVPKVLGVGGQVVFDCGLPACMFTDEQYGALTRHGLHLQGCLPRPGVDTALRLYHCRETVEFPGSSLTNFRKMQQVQEYFFRRHSDLQWDYRHFPDCPSCPTHRFARCQGFCMGLKARTVRDEVDRLRAAVAEDGSFELLAALGRGLFELNRYQDAEQCLVEAMRLEPAHGGVHLLLARTYGFMGRVDEADDEFHKAARLLPQGYNVLMEWAQLLQNEHGKTGRSRRVADEARQLAEEQSKSTPPQ
jgi:tetratricopeptide (TPR) repeat protein